MEHLAAPKRGSLLKQFFRLITRGRHSTKATVYPQASRFRVMELFPLKIIICLASTKFLKSGAMRAVLRPSRPRRWRLGATPWLLPITGREQFARPRPARFISHSLKAVSGLKLCAQLAAG